MPKEFQRKDRVGQLIGEQLSSLLAHHAGDPRFSQLTVTDVEVSRDLSYAKVFVSSYSNDDVDQVGLVKALNKASGYFRTLLAEKIKLRIMPSLSFKYDDSSRRGDDLAAMIEHAVRQDQQHIES